MNDDIIKEGLGTMSSTEPVWLTEAKKYLGQKEVPGPKTNPWIVQMLIKLGLPWRDDETPWCGTFVSWVLTTCKIKPSDHPAGARSYQNWGVKIDKPVPGCIVVFWRGSPKSVNGHVGFVTQITKEGHLVVLGGNQGDAVTERAFDTARVVSYRWPLGVPVPVEALKVGGDYQLSTSEA